MTSATNTNTSAVGIIEPTPGDQHDRPFRFGKPLSYLSERQQVRLLIVRGRLRETPDYSGARLEQ